MYTARARRNQSLTDNIALIEQELLALTFVERERKDVQNTLALEDLILQRAKLAQMLVQLLDMKRLREKLWKETVQNEFCKLYTQNTDDNSWIQEFQAFLDKEPFEVQVKHFAIDFRLVNILTNLYHDLENEDRFQDGSGLQKKLLYYLPCFIDVSLDTLLKSTVSDLLNANILDYELCQVLVSHFQMIHEQQITDGLNNTIHITEGNIWRIFILNYIFFSLIKLLVPSCPEYKELNDETESSKFWCESECVVCLNNKVCIVLLQFVSLTNQITLKAETHSLY